jgi:hypothetical protein
MKRLAAEINLTQRRAAANTCEAESWRRPIMLEDEERRDRASELADRARRDLDSALSEHFGWKPVADYSPCEEKISEALALLDVALFNLDDRPEDLSRGIF